MRERSAAEATGPLHDASSSVVAACGPELRPRASWAGASIGGFAIAFGLITLVAGSRVLLAPDRSGLEGPVIVPLVVFNVVAAIAYVVAGVGIARRRRWSARVAGAIALASGLAFLALAAYAGWGGPVADRSVVVMTLRAGIWSSVALWCWAR